MPEIKTTPQFVKEVQGRTVTGIFAVFGNIDSYQDRLHPGVFTKTFAERGPRKTLFLWQHTFDAPPIAVIDSLREVSVAELPAAVLTDAPDATGGAEVVRTYLDTPRGNEALAAITAGAPLQMSFGYDALKYDFETPPDARDEWDRIRNVREVRLWECSDVLWGANEATVASKARLPFADLLKHLHAHMEALKAGARHSTADVALLNAIHRAALELGCTECAGLVEETNDDEKALGPALDVLKARLGLLTLGGA